MWLSCKLSSLARATLWAPAEPQLDGIELRLCVRERGLELLAELVQPELPRRSARARQWLCAKLAGRLRALCPRRFTLHRDLDPRLEQMVCHTEGSAVRMCGKNAARWR